MLSQCYEKPWDVRKPRLRVKDESYFHTKDDMWNSASHTSPKQEPFYLSNHSGSLFLSATERALPKLPIDEGPVNSRTATSQDRLTRRILERELLQLKSSQRVLVADPDKPPDALPSDRFSDYKNPSRTGTSRPVNGWENLNDLPACRLRLVVPEIAIDRDEKAFEAISAAIAKERKAEEQRRQWQQRNRSKLQVKMGAVRDRNWKQEEKAGVKKEKAAQVPRILPTSERTVELAMPRITGQKHLPSDYSGLLTVDYTAATESAYQTVSRLSYSTRSSKRANSRLFPLPEKLGAVAVLNSRPQTHSRPATVRTQSSLITQKPKDTIGDEMMSRAEVFESMKEIDDFDNRADKEETVAFSKIHFSS